MSDPSADPLRPAPDREELLTRLARGLAHEIKNPLSTMAINLTLLEEEFARAADEDPRARRVTRKIGRAHV